MDIDTFAVNWIDDQVKVMINDNTMTYTGSKLELDNRVSCSSSSSSRTMTLSSSGVSWRVHESMLKSFDQFKPTLIGAMAFLSSAEDRDAMPERSEGKLGDDMGIGVEWEKM